MTYKAQIRPLTIGSDDLVGTANNDTFKAPISTVQDGGGVSEVQTLNNADVIDGGGGNNTLDAVLNGYVAAGGAVSDAADAERTTAPASMTNVQTVNVRSVNADDRQTLSLVNADGVEQVNVNAAVAGMDVAGLQAANLSVANLRGGVGSEVNAFNATNTNITLGLNGVGRANAAGTVNLYSDYVMTNDTPAVDSTAAIVTNLKINLGDRASNVESNLFGTGLESLVATGNGGLTADLSAATNLEKVTTGAGDDVITVDNALLTTDVSRAEAKVIDLGAGDDTLVVDTATGAFALGANVSVKNVETLEFDALIASADLKGIDAEGIVFGGAQATTAITNHADALSLGFKVATAAAAEFTFEGNLTELSLDNQIAAGGLVDIVLKSADFEDGNIKTINLSGGDKSQFEVSFDTDIDLANKVTINIGDFGTEETFVTTRTNLALDYSADGDTAETFKFTGDNVGNIEITDFTAGTKILTNLDRLDFSAMGLKEGDVSIVDNGTATVITALDGQFDGEITLTGISNATSNAVTDDNFIFA